MVAKTIGRGSDIGRLIRARRRSIGMSQSELASAIGVTYQQVQKYERGFNAIETNRLERIAETVGLPPGYFSDSSGLIGQGADKHPPDREPAERADAIDTFMQTEEGARLVCAFLAIADGNLRSHLLGVIESCAAQQLTAGDPRDTGARRGER